MSWNIALISAICFVISFAVMLLMGLHGIKDIEKPSKNKACSFDEEYQAPRCKVRRPLDAFVGVIMPVMLIVIASFYFALFLIVLASSSPAFCECWAHQKIYELYKLAKILTFSYSLPIILCALASIYLLREKVHGSFAFISRDTMIDNWHIRERLLKGCIFHVIGTVLIVICDFIPDASKKESVLLWETLVLIFTVFTFFLSSYFIGCVLIRVVLCALNTPANKKVLGKLYQRVYAQSGEVDAKVNRTNLRWVKYNLKYILHIIPQRECVESETAAEKARILKNCRVQFVSFLDDTDFYNRLDKKTQNKLRNRFAFIYSFIVAGLHLALAILIVTLWKPDSFARKATMYVAISSAAFGLLCFPLVIVMWSKWVSFRRMGIRACIGTHGFAVENCTFDSYAPEFFATYDRNSFLLNKCFSGKIKGYYNVVAALETILSAEDAGTADHHVTDCFFRCLKEHLDQHEEDIPLGLICTYLYSDQRNGGMSDADVAKIMGFPYSVGECEREYLHSFVCAMTHDLRRNEPQDNLERFLEKAVSIKILPGKK